MIAATGAIASSKNATPFTDPTSISGLIAWYDVTDAATITKDGTNLVSQLNDKSGNAYHLIQATGTSKPTYNISGGANNKPYLTFVNGKNLTKLGVVQSLPYTVYAVFRQNSIVGQGYIFTFHQGQSNGVVQMTNGVWNGGGTGIVMETTFMASNVWNYYKNDFAVFGFLFKNGGGIYSINKEPYYSVIGTNAAGMSDIVIGRSASFDLHEFVAYSGTLSLTDDFNIRNYLYSKYSLVNYENIVAFGDSITTGANSTTPNQTGYISLTAWENNKNLYNYAVSGATIYSSLIPFISKANSPYNNGWVTLNYGTNDNTGSSPTGTWASDYKAAIQQLIDLGYQKSKIIIIIPNYQGVSSPSGKNATLSPIIKQIAADIGITYCDFYTLTLNNGGASLLSDDLHPNTAGHRLMADYLKTFIS